MTQEEKQLLLVDLSARIPYQSLCKKIDTEELEDAAKKSARKEFRRPYSDTPDEPIVIIEPDHYEGFIAGANWQKEQDAKKFRNCETATFTRDEFDAEIEKAKAEVKEQMMKKAVEGVITYDNSGNNVVRSGVFNKDFEYGDKVRVIVLPKEDEK